MKILGLRWLLATLLTIVPQNIVSASPPQVGPTSTPNVKSVASDIGKLVDGSTQNSLPTTSFALAAFAPDSNKCSDADDKQNCIAALKARYDFEVYRFTQTKAQYDEQYRETKRLTSLLLWLFIISLLLAALQFAIDLAAKLPSVILAWRRAFKNIADRDNPQPINQATPSLGSFKVSKDGVEFSSSVLGVILLAFSMVFYYLYLQTVYSFHP